MWGSVCVYQKDDVFFSKGMPPKKGGCVKPFF